MGILAPLLTLELGSKVIGVALATAIDKVPARISVIVIKPAPDGCLAGTLSGDVITVVYQTNVTKPEHKTFLGDTQVGEKRTHWALILCLLLTKFVSKLTQQSINLV